MRTKSLKRKLSNIVLLGILLAIIVGIYYNIYNSRAEEVIEIGALALDNYGYLREEEFKLEAKDIGNDLYEIELPETINNKKINSTIKVVLESIQSTIDEDAIAEDIATDANNEELEDVSTEETATALEPTVLEISENKIQLTKDQLENSRIKIEVSYDVALVQQNEDGTYTKNILADKTEEEIKQLEAIKGIKKVYYKILRHEDEENKKMVEVKGYLPHQAQLQVEPVGQEKLTEIFGEAQVDVAYDIKIVIPVEKLVKKENEDGNIETQIVTEYAEINPENFGESCEVTIKDANIVENSQVYHVREDNTYEEITVKENIEESISFEAQTFSVYAITQENNIKVAPLPVPRVRFMPASGAYNKLITIRIDADEPIFKIGQSIGIDGEILWSYIEINDTTTYITYDMPGVEYYVHVLVENKQLVGQYEQWSSGPYVIDYDAPTYSISPESSTTWSQTKDVTVTVTDTLSGLIESNVLFEWKTSASAGGTDQGEPGSLGTHTYSSTSDMEGIYYLGLTITGEDFAGNSISEDTYVGPYYIDNVAPSSIGYTAYYKDNPTEAYTSGTWTNREVYTKITTVDGSGIVDGSGMTFQYRLKDSNQWNDANCKAGGQSQSGTTFSGIEGWDFKDRDDTYYFRAVDAAGNVSEVSNVFTIRYDKTAPEISSTFINGKTVTVTATDASSGIAGYSFDGGSTWQSSNTYTYSSTGSQTIQVKDNVGNISTKTVTISTTTDNVAPTITIGSELTTEKITAEKITADDYGAYVTNYKSINETDKGASIGWRIFYSDGTNIYLITDDYISTNYVPKGKNGATFSTGTTYAKGFSLAPYTDYKGTADVSSALANKLLSKYTMAGYTATSTNSNARATAYLLDTTVWSNFKDSAGYADYAIGGPSLELFVASYNATHTNKTIDIQASNQTGYKVKWSTSTRYSDTLPGLDTSKSLYVINSKTNAYGMWLATPSANADITLISMDYDGILALTGNASVAVRCATYSCSKC